jgi:hypothetical protein
LALLSLSKERRTKHTISKVRQPDSQSTAASSHPIGPLDKQAGGEIKVKQKEQLDPHMPNRPAKEKKCERNGSGDGFL